MVSVSTSKISCGVYQLYELWAPSHLILQKLMGAYKGQARNQGRQHGFAQVLFSDVDLGMVANGDRFAKYLEKNFPGSPIVSLGAISSPSTGNNIRTWIWTIPHAAFVRHKFYGKAKAFDPIRDPSGEANRREANTFRVLNNSRTSLLRDLQDFVNDTFSDLEGELT